METQELPRSKAQRAARGIFAETMYPSSVLGWTGQSTQVNSLAPFGDLISTSTGESIPTFAGETRVEPREHELPLSQSDAFGTPSADAAEWRVASGAASRREELYQFVRYEPLGALPSQRIFGFQVGPLYEGQRFEAAQRFADDQRHWRTIGAVGNATRDSRIEMAAGVDAYARSVGVTNEITAIGDLCLRHVPKARRVLVTVVHDPEDGTTGIHFAVFTPADVEAVVDAEDTLHTELFQRVSAGKRGLFSFGYDFVHY